MEDDADTVQMINSNAKGVMEMKADEEALPDTCKPAHKTFRLVVDQLGDNQVMNHRSIKATHKAVTDLDVKVGEVLDTVKKNGNGNGSGKYKVLKIGPIELNGFNAFDVIKIMIGLAGLAFLLHIAINMADARILPPTGVAAVDAP